MKVKLQILFVSYLMIFLACNSEKAPNNAENSEVKYEEIFGNYVNIKNKYDTLKLFESKKLINVIWDKDSILHSSEGKFELVKQSNVNNNISFCYPRKYGDDYITNCSAIIKENEKNKIRI